MKYNSRNYLRTKNEFKRIINITTDINESFYLWSPRQTGKSTLLKELFKDAFLIDLLKSEVYTKYSLSPQKLREEILLKKPRIVIIDEIQKIPILINEVHWCIENTQTIFGLAGSSSRKLKYNIAIY